MTQIFVEREVHAPVDFVFRTISDIKSLPKIIPNVEKVEFLTETQSDIGTRFRETRIINGKESVTELEITEYVENKYMRMKTDSHGTVWDSLFKVESAGELTRLSLTMDAHAHKIVLKLLHPLMKGMYKKGLDSHVDAVKSYCETQFESSE